MPLPLRRVPRPATVGQDEGGRHCALAAGLDAAHPLRLQRSMPGALPSPLERPKLSLQQPAYREFRLRRPVMDLKDKRLWLVIVVLIVAYAGGWFGGTPTPEPTQ